MAILERISTILRANINDMLSKSEDPEKMLNQILLDMQSAITEARGQVAEMVAQQRLIEADLQRAQALSDQWDAKARDAVRQNRDDLAREALKRRAGYQEQIASLQQQLDAQKALVQQLKDNLSQLEMKYEDAQRTRDQLIARQRRAVAEQEFQKQAQKMNTLDPTSPLSQIQDKVQTEEARASAMEEVQKSSLDAQFEELEKKSKVDDDLEALKREMGQSGGKAGGGGPGSPPAYPS
ncbi:MAG: PspA/IM30 family protein [Anaerolineae bacterium]